VQGFEASHKTTRAGARMEYEHEEGEGKSRILGTPLRALCSLEVSVGIAEG